MRIIHSYRWLVAAVVSSCVSPLTVAATSAAAPVAPSASDTLGRMVWGTVIVLLAIAGIAWFLRRVLPGQTHLSRGVIKQVGGLQLSPRERVVVLEVGGRWLVVGLHGGQMTALGEVSPTAAESGALDNLATPEDSSSTVIDPQASFAVRLQQAMQATLQQKVKSFKNKP
ncbi:flagellar biosynthetic protein FliO [Methylophilus sp. DW102]|uniref:flagellar biosynthetic protein FliO n=1 Tax=Methylophilus sp. DW102 TaxID=3095607 RepID=UPI00308D50A8|nr:flagellar biosynthetic protein FliO [Methylophilus sp. DW102]